MHTCSCTVQHAARRIVLTGGPGAGKTAVLELMRLAFCRHTLILPEAAGILFRGGFPRERAATPLRAAQRAIFHVQRQLEASAAEANAAIVVCDRGTPDGAAYWPGPESLWDEVVSTLQEELARYEMVIHLRTPSDDEGYDLSNPMRLESAAEALEIDRRIAAIWSPHPSYREIPAMPDFLEKARRALELVRALVPGCCRESVSPSFTV